jgi:hypothetical protein
VSPTSRVLMKAAIAPPPPRRTLVSAGRRFAPFLGVALLSLAAVDAVGATRLRYEDLARRLADLEQLAVPPAPGETCRQWSSYDRASRYDAASDRYLAWDANGDGDGYIRREGDRLVLAEMDGPGCLWRIWSAAPKQGRVRIYLDGAAEPAVDLPFAGYFDGRNAPFTRPTLVHSAALGWNNYTPIPYRKSCKIVAEPGWGQYFQFVYTTYPPDTEVPTFRRELSAAENAALDEAERRLSSGGSALAVTSDYGKPGSIVTDSLRTLTKHWTLAPGGQETWELDGPAAIAALRVRLPGFPEGPEARTLLRELTLSIRWDDETEPAVWSPLGDFFGTAAGANPYRSHPCGLTQDATWYAHWLMPFGRRAVLRFGNDGTEPRPISVEVLRTGLQADAGRLLRFHAKWHRDALLPDDPARRAIDWTMVKTSGRGRFAGVMLHVWNPKGSWWGEGDEKFFVDGEKFPSTFGTGSEDYFGYAWCNPSLFANAFHNQTISMNNRGHISVNRWHIPDNIPFQTGFEAAIEKYYANSRPTLYAATVYWYQEAGTSDPYGALGVADRARYWDETMIQTKRVPGAIEGENLAVRSKTGGNPQQQDMAGFGGDWSGDVHLWWTGAKPGDRLALTLPVATAGRYRLKAQFTRAIDYGIVQLAIDGKNLGAPLDLYHDGVVATGPLELGTVELAAGPCELTATITGANPKAVPAYMFALDYLLLEPVRE